MKLNPDCIRDILLLVETVSDDESELLFEAESVSFDDLSRYSAKEVRYHLLQCKKQNLIEIGIEFIDRSIPVFGLTPEGHRFLEAIRPASRWQRLLSAVAKDLRSAALGEIVQLASESLKNDLQE